MSLRAQYYTHYKVKDTSQQKGKLLLDKIIKTAEIEKDSLRLSIAYSDLGLLLNKTNSKESTNSFFKASNYSPAKYPELNIYNFGNIAINKAKQKQFDTATLFLNKAISILIDQNKTLKDISYEDIISNKSINEQSWIIFQNAAEMFLLKYETNNNKKDLEKSLQFFRTTDKLFDYYTLNTTEIYSKLVWRQRASKMYSRALKACYLSQDMELANFFMEKNKAILLANELEKKQRKQSLQIPGNIYAKELLLKKTISTLEREATSKDVSHSQKILLAKKNLQTFVDSVQSVFPSYLPKDLINITTLEVTQKTLEENEINIQFHISEDDDYGIYPNTDNGYIIVTTPSKIIFEEIRNLKNLRQHTEVFLKLLKKPFRTEEDINTYSKHSLAIFHQLFISEEIKDLLLSKKATIIPDNYISLIPFEALTTNKNSSSYLIKQTEISYTYSNSFQTNKQHTTNKSRKNSMLGMAPVTFNALDLATLNYSASEIEKVKSYFPGDFYQEEKATKKRFLETSNTYDLMHLATHADAEEGSSPWIAFSDEKVTLDDLYFTSNKASLVFLSGCNTTLGEQATGEGVMSLARGFFYAGSQSVVATLWSIDDKSTAEIADYFYENLDKGKTKSKALHLAKLSYLENHSLVEASPHFWASYILLGENNTVTETGTLFLYTIVILFLFLLLLTFLLYKRTK